MTVSFVSIEVGTLGSRLVVLWVVRLWNEAVDVAGTDDHDPLLKTIHRPLSSVANVASRLQSAAMEC